MRINWEIFFGASSLVEAIIEFAYLNHSFKEFKNNCYPKECKEVISKLKHKGYKKSRRSAREALIRRGYKIKTKWELVYYD